MADKTSSISSSVTSVVVLLGLLLCCGEFLRVELTLKEHKSKIDTLDTKVNALIPADKGKVLTRESEELFRSFIAEFRQDQKHDRAKRSPSQPQPQNITKANDKYFQDNLLELIRKEFSKAFGMKFHASTGPPSPPGPPGRPGLQGKKGDRGKRGQRGRRGAVGPHAPMGMPGRNGKQGIMGPWGLKGNMGEMGLRGPPGMPGLKGQPGQSISAPDVLVSPPILTINETQSAVFYCSSNGNPQPVIGWSKVDGPSLNNLSVIIHGGRLEIGNATQNASGMYRCRASNILGIAQETTKLSVNFRPRINLAQRPIYIKEGHDVTLPTCHITGYPIPSVTWSKAAGYLPRDRSIIRKSQLTLLKSSQSDSSTYICKAKNILGSTSTGVTLIVVALPVFTVKPPPLSVVIKGGTITFTCSARGDLLTVIQWSRMNGKLPKGRHETRDGLLKIQNADIADSGVYVCTATTAGVSDNKAKTNLTVINNNDCSDWYKLGKRQSGVYKIDPDDRGAFQVYCDMTTDGGGWTVFQRRKDGSVDFYRTWQQYKTGFGNLNGEFWLGNDKIHRLMDRTSSTLRVELEDWNGNRKFAKYGSFGVGNEGSKYRLSVGSYSGTAGDSLAYHKNRPFSTKDRDNDIRAGGSCALAYTGAWWYSKCYDSNLNGRYHGNQRNVGGIVWETFHFDTSLKFSEMKLRLASF